MNLAPNGKPSNLTPEQYKLVRTPKFKDWFGDWENEPENASKVVDSNGEPLVVFRGMSEQSSKKYVFNYNYYQIKESGRRNKFGFYFTDNYDVARGYAIDSSRKKIIEKIKNIYNVYENSNDFEADASKNAIVKEYFVKINNYLDLRSYDSLSYIDLLKILNVSDKDISDFIEKYFWKKSGRFIQKHEEKFAHSKRVVYDLFITQIEEGVDIEDSIGVYFKNKITKKYNGVVFTENTHKKSDTYVVFEPNQIKLADGSNTTFDGNNPDIRYDLGGEVIPKGKEGDCYKNVQDYLLDNDLPNAFIVHGEVTNGLGKTIGHAWIVNGVNVIDPTTGVITTKENYYERLNPKEEARYNIMDAIKMRFKTQNYGAWTDAEVKKILGNGKKFGGGEVLEGAKLLPLTMGKFAIVDAKELKMNNGGEILLAPNGKPSNLTAEQYRIVRTPEFKAWFGDWENSPKTASKVIDEETKEPLVLWHGTISGEKWNIYENFYEDNAIGIYLSKEKGGAEMYGNPRSFYCRITKPLDVSKYKFGHTLTQWTDILQKRGVDISKLKFDSCFTEDYARYESYDAKPEMTYKQIEKVKYIFWELIKINSYWANDGNLIEELRRQGFDGVFSIPESDINGKDVDVFIAWESNQIKLADGSNTTFDSNNPDIRFDNGGTTMKAPKLLAPNGKPSNLTPKQYRLVRTPAFKAWFGDWERLANATIKDPAIDVITLGNISKDVSKVVDENGEPLVVYHGSKSNRFNSFNIISETHRGVEVGSHFGTYIQSQKIIAQRKSKNLAFQLYEVFLCIKNIIRVDDINWWTPANINKFIFQKNKIKISSNNPSAKDVIEQLNKEKIKGFIYSNLHEGGHSYVVFNPNQIKLADGTNTTFDGSNPDIRYSGGGYIGSCVDIGSSNKEVCEYFPNATIMAEYVGNPDENEWGKSKETTPKEFYKYVSKDDVPKKAINGEHTYHYIAQDGSNRDMNINETAIYFIYNIASDIHYFFKKTKYKTGGDLVNEPYISDNFQIGPNGAYEHTEESEIINQYADGVDLKKKLKKPKKPKGDCYYAAAQLVMGNRFKHLFGDNNITYIGTPYLVHAEVRGQGKVANIRFGHAWVEDDENIYDYSNGNEFVMPKEIYYAIGDIDNQNPLKYQKYTFEEARRKMVTTRHYGEWDLEVDY